MKRWIFPVAMLCVLTSGVGRGDMPGGHTPRPLDPLPPQPQPEVALGTCITRLVVKKDDKATETRLILPASLVAGPPGPERGAFRNLPIIMAGLALTVAFVSGGFFLVRKKRGVALVAMFAAVIVFGCSAEKVKVVTYPEPPPEVTVLLPATLRLDEKIVLDVSPGQGDVELIVPAARFVNDKP